MKTWTNTLVILAALASLNSARAQDLGALEREVQTQIQVTKDLSQLVNRVIEQDQSEAEIKHFDYWLKKKALVARVSVALAEYEAYLVNHMDPLKPLYARYNFIAHSDQYTDDQRRILIQDLMSDLTKIVSEKIQPEKIRAYTKLLSAISPYFPVVKSKAKETLDFLTYVRAGSPEKVLNFNVNLRQDSFDLLLLDLANGCYSKTCVKLYASDLESLKKDFFEKIPSHVIINLGEYSDDRKYDESLGWGRARLLKYPKHVTSTEPQLGPEILDQVYKDLPYSLSEEDYQANKVSLEAKLKKNLAAIDSDLGIKRTSDAILKTVQYSSKYCDDGKFTSEGITSTILEMCQVATVPGGEFCLNTKENISKFMQINIQYISSALTCRYDRDKLARKLHAKTMELAYKMKWPK